MFLDKSLSLPVLGHPCCATLGPLFWETSSTVMTSSPTSIGVPRSSSASRGVTRLTSGVLDAWYVIPDSAHMISAADNTRKVWDIFEGGLLFSGKDPELAVYRGRAHLAEMIALLGPPSLELLNRGRFKSKFFSESGE